MADLLYVELLKFKRSKVLWVFLLAAFLPGQFNILIELNDHAGMAWNGTEDFFINNILLLDGPIMHVLLAVLVGHVYAREYSEKTVNSLYTYPFSRRDVYLSKLLVLFLMLVAFNVVAFLSVLLVMWMFTVHTLPLAELIYYFGMYLLSAVMIFALVPFFSLVALMLKSTALTIGVGTMVMVINAFLVSTPFAAWSPWNLPLFLKGTMLDVKGITPYHLDEPAYAVLTLAILFAVMVAAGIVYLKKSDVHSGS